MKRAAAILICILTASGCASSSDLGLRDFAMGGATQAQFFADNRACTAQGNDARDYSAVGLKADNAERHRLYNDAYSACMKAKGYQPRGTALFSGHGISI